MAEMFNDCCHAVAQAELVDRPLDVKTVRINGKLVHIPGPDSALTDHWAIKLPNGKIVGYYSDDQVHTTDAAHSNWYHALTVSGQ